MIYKEKFFVIRPLFINLDIEINNENFKFLLSLISLSISDVQLTSSIRKKRDQRRQEIKKN